MTSKLIGKVTESNGSLELRADRIMWGKRGFAFTVVFGSVSEVLEFAERKGIEIEDKKEER